MRWLLGCMLGVSVLLSGCSLAPTTYQVPDYYETKSIPYHYKVGEVRNIDELKASKNLHSGKWLHHRSYKKKYFFE